MARWFVLIAFIASAAIATSARAVDVCGYSLSRAVGLTGFLCPANGTTVCMSISAITGPCDAPLRCFGGAMKPGFFCSFTLTPKSGPAAKCPFASRRLRGYRCVRRPVVPPPTCGDGSVNQPSEACDGADAAACPGLCLANCTCPGPQPDCVCYHSFDCPPGSSCAYDSFDLCVFQIPKPDGVIGAGCTVPGGMVGGACDGLCVSSAAGSVCGSEDRSALSTAILLWGEATIRPAERGGGPVDQELARQARQLPATAQCSQALSRQVHGAVLVAIAGADLLIHPETPHEDEGHGVADLSETPCLVSALRLGVEALVAEFNTPGAGAPILDGIPGLCPEVLDRAASCGEEIPLNCIKHRVADAGLHLRTRPMPEP